LRAWHPRVHASQALFGHLDGKVNGSVTPIELKYQPAAGEYFHLARMLVTIKDNANFKADEYGGRAALANGVKLTIKDAADNVVLDLTPGHTVQTTSGWAEEASLFQYLDFGSGSVNQAVATWQFTDDLDGHTLDLDGSKGEYFSILISDDLTSLAAHEFHFRGRKTASK